MDICQRLIIRQSPQYSNLRKRYRSTLREHLLRE